MEESSAISSKPSTNNIKIGIICVPEESDKSIPNGVKEDKPKTRNTQRELKSVSTFEPGNVYTQSNKGSARATASMFSAKHSKKRKRSHSSFPLLKTTPHQGGNIMITPELAAQVVKNYLLPMFESDEKRYLRKKYKKLGSGAKEKIETEIETEAEAEGEARRTSDKILKDFGLINQDLEVNGKKHKDTSAHPSSIYNELLLSKQLFEKLENLKVAKQECEEELALTITQRDDRSKKIEELQKSLATSQLKEQYANTSSTKLLKICKKLERDIVGLKKQEKELQQIMSINSKKTSQFSDKSQNEKLRNKVIEFKHTNSLLKMETDIIGDRLNILNQSIMSLGYTKLVEDRMTALISAEHKTIRRMQAEREELELQKNTYMKERDRHANEIDIINKGYKNRIFEKENTISTQKQRINDVEKELKDLKQSHKELEEKFSNIQKNYKNMKVEMEKLQQRLIKMKRTRNVNINQKICKKCQREYLESENFNWSCTTHQAEWGGKMWWCCGKTSKDAQGCVFKKHESKEEEDDFKDLKDKDYDKKYNRVKCQCCKEIGHSTDNCPRDPNFRIQHEIKDEEERVNDLKDGNLKRQI